MDPEYSDLRLRVVALQQAVENAISSDTDAEIVASAEAFYAFLSPTSERK